MKTLLNSVKYGHGNVIVQTEQYTLTRPGNSWDMNYMFYDHMNDITYLIDIDDVENITALDIEELKELAWKTK